MTAILVGTVGTLSIVAGLFFLRFWRSTRDRFFLFFALAFFLEGANRIALYSSVGEQEHLPIYYLIRLASYGLILMAIIGKNWVRRPRV
ncbi:MAG TPA: DUF5985 family protein [Burkholderiales bacterium]|nr:DUF5985 family protein [Burkholderiales bacterium]